MSRRKTMATIGLSGGLTATLGHWIGNLRREFRNDAGRRQLYRKTVNELDGLSDRDLRDIGISRLQIHDIARDAAYGPSR
jgi:uncharacterized protein YjiS (DUF1127 family)